MSLLLSGATIIDGVAKYPIEGQSILIEGTRIKAIGRHGELAIPQGGEVIDAHGKFVIPGLMNANVHLLGDIRLENLARYQDRYDQLIAEAAQVALKNGLTTVFDTWGPRRPLMLVRDQIDTGKTPGSRIFCAGNIIGFDGPFSQDFLVKAADLLSVGFTKRVNAMWVENVGRHLMWLPPEQVLSEVRTYISKGIDFVKYGSNEHFWGAGGAFLAFSPRVQRLMVEEAHRAGITAQAHTMSVEGLRIAIEADCDLIQHCNLTGPTLIPETILELVAERMIGAVIFPLTQRRLDLILEKGPEIDRLGWPVANANARNLIRCGAKLLLGNDGSVYTSEMSNDPLYNRSLLAAGEDRVFDLATGHFAWFRAMEEMGCAPIEMLRAATCNIAIAYGKDKDLGTLEPGKIADLIILDKNPLASADNYRSIHMILKDGVLVDRMALPLHPILTKPMGPPSEEEAAYIPSMTSIGTLPMCPCISR
jgi:imidazolonepropionase-like amidohydrolase